MVDIINNDKVNWETFVNLGFCDGLNQEDKKYLGDLYTYLSKAILANEVDFERLNSNFAPLQLDWQTILFPILRRVYNEVPNLNYISFINALQELTKENTITMNDFENCDAEAEITCMISAKLTDVLKGVYYEC